MYIVRLLIVLFPVNSSSYEDGHVDVHMDVHTYIHTYIHTYLHTYIRTGVSCPQTLAMGDSNERKHRSWMVDTTSEANPFVRWKPIKQYVGSHQAMLIPMVT